VPLHQTILTGQRYPLVDRHPATFSYARFDPANVPHNHTIVTGAAVYYRISYNNRYTYVRADDVDISR
jgi:hypothetical protein